MSLFAEFIDHVAEAAIRSQAKNLVKGWIAAGYLEPTKEAECTAGVVDLVEVGFGMIDKGQKGGA